MLSLDPAKIIESGGLLLIGSIIFAESGLLAGFFLPGDTLLLAAGVFASKGILPLGWLYLVIVGAAVLGDNIGYMIGKKVGHRIFKRPESTFFHPKNIQRAEAFYERHGGKTVIFARFIPMARTFVPIVAGVGHMHHKRYVIYDLLGCTIWGVGVTSLGYAFGSHIPNMDNYILPAILIAVGCSFVPGLFHLARQNGWLGGRKKGSSEDSSE